MNWDRLKLQLESILHTEFRIERMKLTDWKALGGTQSSSDFTSRERQGSLYFPISQERDGVTVMVADTSLMTESERQLVEVALDAYRSTDRKAKPRTERDLFITGVREWIEDRIASGVLDEQEPPAQLNGFPALYATKIPFLIDGEYVGSGKQDDIEMKKLLESFFDEDIVLIPLKEKEWLILADDSLLEDTEDEDADESVEERLASLCTGVHSVILNEGAGECHVTVYYPIIPGKSLPLTVSKLREAISVGRLQRVDQYIHLPWELYLDQLLGSISHADRLRFIEQVFKRKEALLDTETIQTLETFFEMDCNVSETAKKLFIHRNTLLYRLDKFKQESGLDVRTFNQAVHVKIALQLYKVTKRP